MKVLKAIVLIAIPFSFSIRAEIIGCPPEAIEPFLEASRESASFCSSSIFPGCPSNNYIGYLPGSNTFYCKIANCGPYANVTYASSFLPTCNFDSFVNLETGTSQIKAPFCRNGSIIQVSNQILGESLPVVGSSFSLNYFTDRVIGRKADYIIELPITGSEVATGVENITLDIIKNGQVEQNKYFANLPNQKTKYTWNGAEEGDDTWGSVLRDFRFTQNFTGGRSVPITKRNVPIGSFKAKKLGLGGWVPSVWHFYDEPSLTIFLGDGTRLKANAVIENGLKRIASESGDEVYYFDNYGKIISTKNGLTGSVKYTFTYDSEERLATIAEPFNRVTTFSRYLNGKLKAIITPEKIKSIIKINSQGYLASLTNPNNEIFSITYYGSGGLLKTFSKPNGSVSTMTYDGSGNLLTDTHSGGALSSLIKTSEGVNATSAMGRLTSTSFDKDTKIENQIFPSGTNELFAYTGYRSDYATPFKVNTTIFVDDLRFGSQVKAASEVSLTNFGVRDTSISRSVDLSVPTDPFSINSLTEITSVGNSVITSVYTGSTRIKEITTKLGRKIKVQIDQYERPIMIQKGDQVPQNFTYTDEKLTKITQGTRKKVLSYYSNNLLKSIRNTLGEVTTYVYDKAQRLYSKTLPDTRIVDYDYDTEGNLARIWPPERKVHQFTYGSNEKLSSYKPPATDWGATETITNYSYNLDKQLTQIARPDGKNIDFNYNITTGLLDSIVSDSGTVTYASYLDERPATINYNGFQMNLNYLGSIVMAVSLKDSSSNYIYNYQRTPDSLAGEKVGSETINGGNSSSIPQTINYSYDDDEMLSNAGDMELHYNTPNGQLEHTKLGSIRDYHYYNTFGEIRSYKAKFQSDEIYSYDLARDSIGRIIQKKETLNGVTSTFDYIFDNSGRLVEVKLNGVTSSTYVYDENGNRIEGMIRGQITTAYYERQDRLLQYNETGYNYNLNGDLDYKGLPTGEISESSEYFNYDVFGNLSEYSGRTNIRYEVDPLLRRLGKTVDGVLKQRYVYNPEGQLIGELEGTNKLVKTFVYATKTHVPDYYIDSSNNKFRIITDHLGSVRLLIAVTSGRVLKIMEHDEFGRVLQDTRPGFLPFGFAGGIYEKETGLVRFGARDYDPQTGRWASKDPIRFDGKDTNLYGYVMQDPINFIDPTGLITEEQFWGALQIVGGGVQGAIGGGVIVGGNTAAVVGGAAIAGPTLGVAIIPGLGFAVGVSAISNKIGSDFVSSGRNNIIEGYQRLFGPIIPDSQQCPAPVKK